MVNLMPAWLDERCYPEEAPRGKGVRVASQEGPVGFSHAPTLKVLQHYREACMLEFEGPPASTLPSLSGSLSNVNYQVGWVVAMVRPAARRSSAGFMTSTLPHAEPGLDAPTYADRGQGKTHNGAVRQVQACDFSSCVERR